MTVTPFLDCQVPRRGRRDRPELAVGGDAEDLLRQDDLGAGRTLREQRVAGGGDRGRRRRGRRGRRRGTGRPGERLGHRDPAPPRGALVGAVPVEGEVDVVGVRRDAVVGGPAPLGSPGLPLLAVEDDVVDAEPSGHRPGAALRVGRGQPAGQRVGESQVGGLGRVDHPVQRTTLAVLGGALAQDAVGVGPVGRVEQLGERDGAGLVLGEAAGALLVERGHVEGGRQRARRLGVRDGRGLGGRREHREGDHRGGHRADGAHGHPAVTAELGLGCGHDGVLLGQGAPSQGLKTHQSLVSRASRATLSSHETTWPPSCLICPQAPAIESF